MTARAAPNDAATASTEARAEAAIAAFCSGSATVAIPALQAHLRQAHRIGVTAFWIKLRLQRLGWFAHGKGRDGVTVWKPVDPRRPFDIPPHAMRGEGDHPATPDGGGVADPPPLLAAAERVLDWAMRAQRLNDQPFRDLNAAVLAERGRR